MSSVSAGWDVVENSVGWRAKYELEREGRTRAEIDAALEETVIELPPRVVDAALCAEVRPSPFGRVLPVYDDAA